MTKRRSRPVSRPAGKKVGSVRRSDVRSTARPASGSNKARLREMRERLMAQRSAKGSPRRKAMESRMSRAGFLRTAGVAGAGVGAAAVGLGGVAKAQTPPGTIDVYPSGSYPYFGPDGLKAAIVDVADGGTVRVHYGTYDIGNTKLEILLKGLILIGVDGKPEIKGNASNGVVLVKAPGKGVELNNLYIKSYYGAIDGRIVEDNGSSSFRVIGCDVVGNGRNGPGIAMSIGAPDGSDNDPTIDGQFDVTGEIIIQNSNLLDTSKTGLWIGWFGPVYKLDYVEVSGCTVDPAGEPGQESFNNGNYGIGLVPTAAATVTFMSGEYHPLHNPLPWYVETTHGNTITKITGNTINCANPIMYLFQRGMVEIKDNTCDVSGYLFWGGVLFSQAITAAGSQYPMTGQQPYGLPPYTNEIPYSKGVISGNTINFTIPDLPFVATEVSNAIQVGHLG
jgi:hypothetical protein